MAGAAQLAQSDVRFIASLLADEFSASAISAPTVWTSHRQVAALYGLRGRAAGVLLPVLFDVGTTNDTLRADPLTWA